MVISTHFMTHWSWHRYLLSISVAQWVLDLIYERAGPEFENSRNFCFYKTQYIFKSWFSPKIIQFFLSFSSWIFLNSISWRNIMKLTCIFQSVWRTLNNCYFWYDFPEKFQEQGWIVWFADPKMEHRLMLNQKGEAILSCKVSRITQYFRDLCFPVLRPLIINLIIYLNTILYL